jgi:asparagine synthetase B (glutamine-hydrolysing)
MGQLAELARGIDRLGPDGGSEHLNQNLGFAYRACHTTPESASEVQPLIRPDCILTWDGRLDNRDELGSRLRPGATSAPTDAELVLGA